MGTFFSKLRTLLLSNKATHTLINIFHDSIDSHTEMELEGIEHRTVTFNGINMHIAEKGQGPLILFIHGFPDLWYSWRHQITYLACHGYRCVAPDLRGYGDTDIPASPTSYTSLHIVGDIIGLLDAIAGDQEKVFVVGHDWGALTAWYLSLYRPERIKALVNLSVAFTPRNPKRKPLDTLRAVYGNDYYISRFQVSFIPSVPIDKLP
jgi:pimeloyl-ACP methyl ester carboxylesterase